VLAAGESFAALATFPRRSAAREALGRLAVLLQSLAGGDRTPSDAVDRVLGYYEPILRETYRDDHPRRTKDLEHLATIAARYRSLDSMLADFALEPPSDTVGDALADDPEDDLLTLSTIHSAKGLEWHTVFVLWAAEGRFPASYVVGDEEQLEEERRLCYVAITRAKQNLHLSYPIEFFDRGAGFVFGRPSRFVSGLAESVLKPVAVVEETS
jgi:DNA helicase-2/ATP-dependent DNA helicase PcrA